MKLTRHIILFLLFICSSEVLAQLNHKHFILTWRAIKADQKDKERLGRELLEFRIANKFKLNCNYLTLCTRELQARDISGIKRADKAMAPKQKK